MRLLFVSPRFLFPADEGGKIRTGQVLRGMKGGAFEITLLAPAPATNEWQSELDELCDHFVSWTPQVHGSAHKLTRLRHLFGGLPIPVATDRHEPARRVIAEQLALQPDVAVFDFVHAAVLMPRALNVPAVMFTHNVETEIFRRQVDVASNPVARAIWANQTRKMERFERESLQRFDEVVAVSQRDADHFRDTLGLPHVSAISTGVDLDARPWNAPDESGRVVFTGALDWHANVEGIGWMLDEVWPTVRAELPHAELIIVGRNPPDALVQQGATMGCRFTGFVDSILPHVKGASAYVIPLRVGGGTRIKAFEAMALGPPVVSTGVGVEGLPVEPGEHYLRADEAPAFAEALLGLLRDTERARALSRRAREYVEKNWSSARPAREFEEICVRAVGRRAGAIAPT
ncbi:MAG: biofilm formation protein PslH [Planctomycetota bacterium]|nr:MAG: biofilm formation protein PslH [Planctomycetota bacterium]